MRVATYAQQPLSTSAGANTILVERERELAELASALQSASGGAGHAIMIEAGAGIGKSSLLEAAAELASDADMRVLRATGRELEQSFPFGVAIQLFEPIWAAANETERAALGMGSGGLATALLEGRLSEALGLSGDHGYPLIHGLFWLATNLSSSRTGRVAGRPVAMLVDDLQWVDRPSLRFLAYLGRRLPRLPIAIVSTVCPGEPLADRAAIEALRRLRPALTPSPLTERGVATLVEAEFPDANRAFVAACGRVTRGNPFLLIELLAQLRADRLTPDSDTAARLMDLAPGTIVNAVVARLGTLSPPAQALASAVALLGDRVAVNDAARLVELDSSAAAEAADMLSSIHLLDPGVPLSFVHPMIRSAVLASMSPVARGQAHRRAAAMLRANGAPARTVAAHLLAAPADQDSEALETLRSAARDRLRSGEADSAARLLERALAERPAPELYAEVLAELGQAEALAGLPHAPGRLDEAIRVTSEPERRAELALAQGRALMAHGRHGDAAAVFETGLQECDDVDGTLGDELDAAFISAAALVPKLVPEAFARRRRMLDRLQGPPDAGQRSALARTVLEDSLRGEQRSTVRRIADLAWGDGTLLAPDAADDLTLSSLAAALLFADELEREVELCEAMSLVARDPASRLADATVSYCRTWPLYEQGKVAEAAADVRAALDAPGDGATHARTADGALACCQMQRGQVDEAERTLAIIEEADVNGSARYPFLLDVRAQLRLAQHRPREALDDALRAGDRLRTDFSVANPGVVAWRSTAALALLALGDSGRAEELAADELEHAQRIGVTRVVIRDLRVLGLAAGGEAGIELLEEAVRTAESYPMRLESMHALVDLGAALRRAKKRAASREPLRRALELSHRGGASAISARAQTELAASGARPRRILLTGVAALTPSERRVAQLAAKGMTTREIAESLFVSPKTVEYHLRHTYRKLDVGSRSELSDALLAEQAA